MDSYISQNLFPFLFSDRADDNSQMTALIAGITVPAIVFTCVLIALVCRLRHDSIPDGN